MGDKSRGLYNKFRIQRADGSHKFGGKHHGCQYFVLDLTHDKHAKAALLAYAESCKDEYPFLSHDLLCQLQSACAHPIEWRTDDTCGVCLTRGLPADGGVES